MSDPVGTPAAGDGDAVRATFTCDGRTIAFTPGQSIAGALWAHGDRALSRSIKYHRPRGFSCGIGKCADCSMRVDGIPDVRTCVTPARAGARVEGQNAWPNVRHDLFRASDLAFWRGLDHHHGFVRPRFLYPIFTATMRRFAGWGRLPDPGAAASAAGRTEALSPDVLVVGGGPAGLAAAVAAAQAGAGVLVLDEGIGLGGHAARMLRPVPDPDDAGAGPVACAELVARWRAEVAALPGIEIRHRTALAAAYRDGLFLALGVGLLAAVRPRATVVATGGYDAQAEFGGNDMPGVMSATACQALLHREGVVPGRRAVVYGCGAHGAQVALDLAAAGVEVAAVVEPAPVPPAPAVLQHDLAGRFLPVMSATRVVRAHGWGRMRGVTVEDAEGRSYLPCDVLVVALGRKTTPEVFQSLGARLVYDPLRGGAVPLLTPQNETSVAGVFAAGDAAGVGTLATARSSGRAAGTAAAAHARGAHGRVAVLA